MRQQDDWLAPGASDDDLDPEAVNASPDALRIKLQEARQDFERAMEEAPRVSPLEWWTAYKRRRAGIDPPSAMTLARKRIEQLQFECHSLKRIKEELAYKALPRKQEGESEPELPPASGAFATTELLQEALLEVPSLYTAVDASDDSPMAQLADQVPTPKLAEACSFRPIGYTTIQRYIHNLRWLLIQHRASKKEWKGRREEYREMERSLVVVLRSWKERLQDPYYQRKVRKAKNRARRKYRRPLKAVKVMGWQGLRQEEEEHLGHLPWMIARLKKKRFKSVQHVATVYNKPVDWVKEALNKAVEANMITTEELTACFRGPGRPKVGKPRGPYRKKEKKGPEGTIKRQHISAKLLKDLAAGP